MNSLGPPPKNNNLSSLFEKNARGVLFSKMKLSFFASILMVFIKCIFGDGETGWKGTRRDFGG